MEINEEHSNETKQRLFIQILPYSKGVRLPLEAGRDAKAGKGMRKVSSEKGEDFKSTLTGSCWHEKAGGLELLEGHPM